MQSHLWLINSNFQEALSDQLRSLPNLNKPSILQNMNVISASQMAPNRASGDALKNIILDYTCEWPLEIIIDK